MAEALRPDCFGPAVWWNRPGEAAGELVLPDSEERRTNYGSICQMAEWFPARSGRAPKYAVAGAGNIPVIASSHGPGGSSGAVRLYGVYVYAINGFRYGSGHRLM